MLNLLCCENMSCQATLLLLTIAFIAVSKNSIGKSFTICNRIITCQWLKNQCHTQDRIWRVLFSDPVPAGRLVTLVSASLSSIWMSDLTKSGESAIDGKLSVPNARTNIESRPWLTVKFAEMNCVSSIWTIMGAGASIASKSVIEVWVLR